MVVPIRTNTNCESMVADERNVMVVVVVVVVATILMEADRQMNQWMVVRDTFVLPPFSVDCMCRSLPSRFLELID